MTRRLVWALIAVALLSGTVMAAPRSREERLHPRDVSAKPSYVDRIEKAIVGVKVRARHDAVSSARLGVHRFASGVVFDARGYAVTVSYALMDALEIEVLRRDGRTVSGTLVGFDLESGLGVIKLEGDGWTAATLGQSRDVAEGMLTGTVGVDEDNDLIHIVGVVRSVRRFAASWEYMLERAFIVAPSSPSWGGSALVNDRGDLIGIGSLRLGEKPSYSNLFIPIERFLPVKDEIITAGRVQSRTPRPWLGVYTSTDHDGVTIDGFSPIGPAVRAGFKRGDRITGVNGVSVRSQEEFYEALWKNSAGEVINLSVRRDDRTVVIPVQSVDRVRMLTGPRP
jgi:S1-C subfamily serine protease